MTGQELKTIDETSGLAVMAEQLALNPEVSVDKLEKMLDMQERILDRQAKQDFVAAMVKVQQDIPAIKKGKQNKQTNSSYADLDFINSIIKPIYTREGFSLTFGTDGAVIPETVRIVCDVLHAGGHSKTYTYDAPIDDKGIKGSVNKTATHARASATTYAQRYLVKMIFNITLTDEDDDGNKAGAPILSDDLLMLISEAKTIPDLQAVYKNDCDSNQDYNEAINVQMAKIKKGGMK